jgi:Rv2525c-like, glycoside hydrolase-like domain
MSSRGTHPCPETDSAAIRAAATRGARGLIRFASRRLTACLAAGGLIAAGAAGTAAAAARAPVTVGWKQVSYAGVTLQVPDSWPAVNLTAHPSACPRLDVHAVYLGTPGPDPACPASGLGAKTSAVQITHLVAGSPDALAATRPVVIGGRHARTNPDAAITHTIIDVFPAFGMEVALSFGSDQAVVGHVQSSIRISGHGTVRAAPRAPRLAAAQGVYRGRGFDACAAPASGTMNAWLGSPYRAIGIYIGGINRACAQASLTASWINAIQGRGWHYLPLYPGLQATCGPAGNATINPNIPAAQGRSAAADAVTQAQHLGIPAGTPIVYDMEAYNGCGGQVISYLNAWDKELHAKGYLAGVYESFSNVTDLINARRSMTEPDVIYYADWDGQATTVSSYMPPGLWASHQRIHQYQGGHNETYRGQTINIDNDQFDANLGGVLPGDHTGFHVSVGINTNKAAEWFARAANGRLVHDYQNRSASNGWAAVSTLGSSPATIVSNPAEATNQDGRLEVFARDNAGRVLHAWQGHGGTAGWVWGSSPGSGSPGTTRGDPAATRGPGGQVVVFVADTNGTVATTMQKGPNGAGGWAAWANIKGSCAGWPVPFADSAKTLEVFCRTTAGTIAMSTWKGSAWSAWATVGSSPSNLTADPAVVTDAAGHTELFATTWSGSLDHASQNATGGWNWNAPLTTNSAGAGVSRTPTAIVWPDRRIEVFFQLSNGRLGHAAQKAAGGTTGWSAITAMGGTILGSPRAWVGASGAPEIAGLDANHAIAHDSWTGRAWTGWVQLGGSF